MRPVRQTIFRERYRKPDAPPGNCFQATVASILELELDYVPNVMALPGQWQIHLNLYLEPFNLSYFEVSRQQLRYAHLIEQFGGFYVWTGMGPRTARHSVVGYRGKVAHDPHPEGGGLLVEDGTPERDHVYGFFITRDPARCLRR